jgi:hypothetical protein
LPEYDTRKISTALFINDPSDRGQCSTILLNHREMVHHQVALVSSGALAVGKYNVRIILDVDDSLEATVDIGKILDVTGGKDSAFVQFSAVLKGIYLEEDTVFTSGETISVVISSSVIPFVLNV